MRSRRDLTGSLLGLVVFLGGVALLVLTFKLAHDLFSVPHARALGLEKGKDLDMNATSGAAMDLLIRIVTLLVMAIVGSVITNKGIGLYSRSLHPVERHDPLTPEIRTETRAETPPSE